MKMARYNVNCNNNNKNIIQFLYIFIVTFLLFDKINFVTCNNEELTACEHLRQAEYRRAKSFGSDSIKSVRIPRCTKIGDFEPVQCSNELNSTECWCVDEYGVEIIGTKNFNQKDINCTKIETTCPAYSCRMYCPSGFARDLRSGCSICQCRDPCSGVECPGGLACQPQEVKCKKEPCPPVPTCKRARSLGDLCPAGEPLAITDTHRPFLCGTTPGKPNCPPLYQCLVQSGNDYGVCCPASLKIQKPGMCPNADDYQSSDSNEFMCGDSCGYDLQCPQMQKCCHRNGCGHNCIQPINVTTCHQAKMLSEILSVNEREGRGYIPQCDGPGGIFSVRQCSRNGLVCWCVDSQTGNKMKGSMGASHMVTCNDIDNSISRSNGRSFDTSNGCDQNICAAICEYGFKIDHNGCSTCECAEPCEGFVCSKNFHCEVAKDPQCLSGSALCASEPVCQPDIIYSNPCIIGTPLTINNNSAEILYCQQEESTSASIQARSFYDSDEKENEKVCPKDYKCTKMYSNAKSVCCPEETELTVSTEKWERPQTMCEYLRDFSEKMEGTEVGMSLAIIAPKCDTDGGYHSIQCKRKTIKVSKIEKKRLIEEKNIRQMKTIIDNKQNEQERIKRDVNKNNKLLRIIDMENTDNIQMATSNVIDYLKQKLENPLNNEEEMLLSEIMSSQLFDSSGLEGRHAKVIGNIGNGNSKLQDLNIEQNKNKNNNDYINKLKPVIIPEIKIPITTKPDLFVDVEIEVDIDVDECWCVDGFGTEIPKTKSTNTTTEMCENLRQNLECLDLTCRMGCDYGFLLDSETQCPSCECRDPCDNVECAEGQECRTVEVSCVGEYCPAVPACLQRKPGQCPFLVPPGNEGSSTDFCDYECRSDYHCDGDMRCCSNGCGTQCVSPQMKTACQHLQTIHLHQAVELGVPAKQKYIAQCDEKDGSWKSIQCGPDNICWCVDQDGNEKSGTRASKENTNCELKSLVECPLYKCHPCEHGYLLDKNGCRSCECRDPCKEISCPFGESCELVQIECIDSPCPKMPICVPFHESVCTEGLPLKINGRDTSCGPQNDIDNCPTTHTCSLDPMTNKGFCCPKTRDVCFESLDENCIHNFYKMENSTNELSSKWKFSPRQNKCVSILVPVNMSSMCQSKNLFHSEIGCKSVCPVLSQCERLRLKNLLAAKRSGQTTAWFSPRCDTEGSWSPVQCLGQMDDSIDRNLETKQNNINVCWCADKKGAPIKGSLTRGEPKCNHRQARRRMHVEENDSDPVMEELIRQMTILGDNDMMEEDVETFETINEKRATIITTVTEKILDHVNHLEKNINGINEKLVATTTRCNALRQTASFTVACNENGTFVPTQCNGEICWCVDAAGNQLPSTSTFNTDEIQCSYTPIDLVEVEIYLNNPHKIPLKDVYDVLKQETRVLLGSNPENLRVHENVDGNILLRFDLVDENKIDTAFALEEMFKQSNLLLYNNNLSPDITQSRFLHRNSNVLPVPQKAAGTVENTFHMVIFVLTTGSAFLISIFVVFIMLKRGKNKSKQFSNNKSIGQGDKYLDYSSPIFVLSANEKINSI